MQVKRATNIGPTKRIADRLTCVDRAWGKLFGNPPAELRRLCMLDHAAWHVLLTISLRSLDLSDLCGYSLTCRGRYNAISIGSILILYLLLADIALPARQFIFSVPLNSQLPFSLLSSFPDFSSKLLNTHIELLPFPKPSAVLYILCQWILHNGRRLRFSFHCFRHRPIHRVLGWCRRGINHVGRR